MSDPVKSTVNEVNAAFTDLVKKAKALPSSVIEDLNIHIQDALLREQSWKHRRPDTYALIALCGGFIAGGVLGWLV